MKVLFHHFPFNWINYWDYSKLENNNNKIKTIIDEGRLILENSWWLFLLLASTYARIDCISKIAYISSKLRLFRIWISQKDSFQQYLTPSFQRMSSCWVILAPKSWFFWWKEGFKPCCSRRFAGNCWSKDLKSIWASSKQC